MWFMARGWAVGGAVTGIVVAALTSPPYYLVDQGWFTVLMFGSSAVLMGLLAVWPWKDWLRNLAVSTFVFALVARSFGLAFQGHGEERTRMIGAAVWLFVAYLVLGLAAGTIREGHRARK